MHRSLLTHLLLLVAALTPVAAQTVAPDFALLTREGTETTLYALLDAKQEASSDSLTPRQERDSESETGQETQTLLLFYNSDCRECLADIDEAAQSPVLAATLADGSLRVIAVDPYDDRELWLAMLPHIPQGWDAAFDLDGILDLDLYDYSTPPACFLIDSEKNIIKTCTLHDILLP